MFQLGGCYATENSNSQRTDVIGKPFGNEHRAGLGAAFSCALCERGEELKVSHHDANTFIISGPLPPIEPACIVTNSTGLFIALVEAAYRKTQFFWYVCKHVIRPFRTASSRASTEGHIRWL
jgi:hypothetical protein